MSRELEPNDAAWTVAFDTRGKDLALEAELASMSDEERARTERNVRAFIERVRPTLRPRSR
jgi:hypothetical protein